MRKKRSLATYNSSSKDMLVVVFNRGRERRQKPTVMYDCFDETCVSSQMYSKYVR
jgi:hypothetical protein